MAARMQDRIDAASQGQPIVATILTPRYGMRGMFYKKARPGETPPGPAGLGAAGFPSIYRSYMGRDPSTTNEPVEVVFSRAVSTYRPELSLDEALDPGVRLIPLAVIEVNPNTGRTLEFFVPLPRNAWGAGIVMPVL